MQVLTIHLTPRDAARLNRLATVMGVPAGELAEEAVRAFVQEGLRRPRRDVSSTPVVLRNCADRRTKVEPAPPPRQPRFIERDDGFDVVWDGSVNVRPTEALGKVTDVPRES